MAYDTTAPSLAQIDEWVRRAYHPHRSLGPLLGELASSLMHWLPLRELMLDIKGVETLQMRCEAGSIRVDWGPRGAVLQGPVGPEMAASTWMDRHDRAPIIYAGMVMGHLSIRWQAGLAGPLLSGAALDHLCAWLARICHRYRVQAWSQNGYRPPGVLVGASAPLAGFECFVERAANSDLAVLIRGEFGTEKAWAATAIHAGSRRQSGPLVEVHCAHPLDGPAAWLQRASGGTLFLNGIDELAPALQVALLGHWLATHQPSQENSAEPGVAIGVRLVAATTADLRRPGIAPLVSQALHAELDYLYAELPALRLRPGDIPFLMTAALERLDPTQTRQYTAPLQQAFQAYAWPGNLSELERAMACLATLAEGPVMDLADARRLTPWLVPQTTDPATMVATLEAATPDTGAAEHLLPEVGPLRPLAPSTGSGLTAVPLSTSRRSTPEWVGIVLERQVRVLDTLHPGLRRALLFLSEHFAEPVTLTELSSEAHVSASHLTYLFRSSLGLSFKSFLLSVRIHVAQQLLLQPQLRITEVALRAGFADLSHFERCFRRAVGRSAREHRRALAGSE